MKKIYAVIAGICLAFLIIGGFKLHMNASIQENMTGIRNLRTYERFHSSEVQKLIIEENTLPVLGSSELTPLSEIDNEIYSFLNGEEMNIVTIGAGNFQSLSHAITLGAIADSVPSKKVALFLSPQWFSQTGITADAFAARMSEDELLGFLKNKKISLSNKIYALDRAVDLLENSPTQLARIKKYRNGLDNKISLDGIYLEIMNLYWKYRSEYEVYQQLGDVSNNVPVYDLSALDYEKLLEKAEQQGNERCNNNEYGIYDKYWDTYVKEVYAEGEILEKNQVYVESPEYDDLRCFLNVAKELDIEVILVSIPVHGAWYEYRGQLCDEYYDKIRVLAEEYDNVYLADMSIYENEKYFLRDIMHLGWKGWVRINEELYNYFVK